MSAIKPDEPPGAWWGLTPVPLPIGHRFLGRHVAVHGLGFHAVSVKSARDFSQAVLRDWGICETAGLLNEVRLVVSELVTNACRHAAPEPVAPETEWSIQLGLHRDGANLTCMVFDPSRRVPQLSDQAGLEEGGRGLRLIESFSSDWGWQPLGGQGKVVWAALAMAESS
ncbi:anti-sigma regulatory factor (Ser/Thr protein kinase) [Lipingzhangella halophila]|uniref:Anti-sigma regulatory factor (Ser/Thr protein kinase) n=1 Tax=Lipingzhangella halophila TaxID=1783352 RepID=A0A7W7W330_9ACTN|nr:ATP-binding protein [Lipingzhangella halophila]MBB4932607.1 anti-sigma regulatory factor (Ser/Thr protein kinase) [Lipingzhangella halophila]